MAEEQQKREDENNEIKEMGTLNMKESGSKYGIQLLTIIGEIEGHDSVSGNTKATKYEHLLPRLAQIEEDDETDGVLILLNTLGGDVEAGLAIAEMIASLSKRCRSYLGEVIQLEARWLCRQIIPLLCRRVR